MILYPTWKIIEKGQTLVIRSLPYALTRLKRVVVRIRSLTVRDLVRLLHPNELIASTFYMLAITLSKLKLYRLTEWILKIGVKHFPKKSKLLHLLGGLAKRRGDIQLANKYYKLSLGFLDVENSINRDQKYVVFLFQYVQGWSCLESIWFAFSRDPAIKTVIVAVPDIYPQTPLAQQEASIGFLREKSIPFVYWKDFRVEFERPDVIVYQTPYEESRPNDLRSYNVFRYVDKLVYIPYALETGGYNYRLRHNFNMYLQQVAWRIYARSVSHKACFDIYCESGSNHVVVSGHPKFDSLVAAMGSKGNRISSEKFRKVFLWNPHHSVTGDASNLSTFTQILEPMISFFLDNPQFKLKIRPHPFLIETLIISGLMDRKGVNLLINRLQDINNIELDFSYEYKDAFLESDALISDASSFLIEYVVTGKPILFVYNKKAPKLNVDGDYIYNNLYLSESGSFDDVKKFIFMVDADSDPYLINRLTNFQKIIHLPDEGAGEFIKNDIVMGLIRQK